MELVNRILRREFRRVGERVALYPNYFILGSIIISLTLGTGLFRINYENDVNQLYINSKGLSVHEKQQIDKYFSANYSGVFSTSRITDKGRLARIIVTAKDGGTLLRSSIWTEVAHLDKILHSLNISYLGRTYSYKELCARPKINNCFENEVLELGALMGQVENGSLLLNYPITINPQTYTAHLLPTNFAGLTLSSNNSTLLNSGALNINYFLMFESLEDDERGILWEKEVTATMLKLAIDWRHITVFHFTSDSILTEQDESTFIAIPYFVATVIPMCIFAIFTTMSRDLVSGKPWVSLSGILASNLGCLAAFGSGCYIGIPFTSINLSIMFIMLGIGIDDMFVILSAWRHTSVLDDVKKRLGDTYSEAAVSITITTLTDMISFYVGLLTPIPAVQIFSAYAGTSILYIYFLQIFFVGATLAICGKHEAEKRHSIFWCLRVKSMPKEITSNLFCGGMCKLYSTTQSDNGESRVMCFFRDNFAKFITKKWVQTFVLVTYITYVGISIYGVLKLDEGLRQDRFYKDDSYMAHFLQADNKYFRGFKFRIQLAITTPLDYSKPETKARVYEILESVTNSSKYVSPNYSENWLKGYTDYLSMYSTFLDLNVTTEQQFISTLKEYYLPNNIYTQDVVFNEDGTRIIASRFIIQLVNTFSSDDCEEAVVKLRKVTAAQTDMEVIPYHLMFNYVDKNIPIRAWTIQILSLAAGMVMVVSVVLIPNLVTSCCVFFSIVSTELGLIGLMSLWGVSLDMMSIICLMICIGFSVDFAAHVSYAYISSTGNSEERMEKTMYRLGLPILQGGFSTLIGIMSTILIPSYTFQVVFKLIFLVITLAMWHGLILLPVILLCIKPESIGEKFFNRKTYNVNEASLS